MGCWIVSHNSWHTEEGGGVGVRTEIENKIAF